MIIKKLIFNILAPLGALGLTLFVLPFIIVAVLWVAAGADGAITSYLAWTVEVMKYLGG